MTNFTEDIESANLPLNVGNNSDILSSRELVWIISVLWWPGQFKPIFLVFSDWNGG